MTVFFTSDQHFYHTNILKYCKRNFKNIEEMNETIIANYNSKVTDKDDVYILGDAVWATHKYFEIFSRLKGRKHIILGNHCNLQLYKKLLIDGLVVSVDVCKGINVKGKVIWLSHYPHRSWNCSAHGSWHLYGHCHNTLPDYGYSTDVGVDKWNYFPVSFEELETYFNDTMFNRDLNKDIRNNYKDYKKKFEEHFINKYKERIEEDAVELDKLLEEKIKEIEFDFNNVGELPNFNY